MPVEYRAGGADDGLAGEDAPPARLLPLLRPRQRWRRHPGNNRCLLDRGLVAAEVDAGSNGRGVIQVSNRGPSTKLQDSIHKPQHFLKRKESRSGIEPRSFRLPA